MGHELFRRQKERHRLEATVQALKTLRVGKIIEEYDLQDKIAQALLRASISFKKEYRLGPGSRVDFLTGSGVAIEVKKGKPNRAKLVEQIKKYARYDEVKAVIIVVETSLRIPILDSGGKPCTVMGLQKLWGIAL